MDTDKVVLLGYPKTGNTWARLLFGRYLQSAYRLSELLLLDGSRAENEVCRRNALPLFETTHGPLTWENQDAAALNFENAVAPYLAAKVALIVRHPLDTIVSHFMHHHYQAGHEQRKKFADPAEFAADPVFGLEKFFKFHELWQPLVESGAVLLMRYEDMKADPFLAGRRLVSHAGAKWDEAALEEAVRFSSFVNMRSMEEGEAPRYKESGFRIFATGQSSEPRARHVRQGVVGGYRKEFDAATVARLEQRIRERMPAVYGYSNAV